MSEILDYSGEIIDEKVPGTEINFVDIYKIYIKILTEDRGLFDGIEDKYEESFRKRFKIFGNLKDLHCDYDIVHDPILLTFITTTERKKYRIFTERYLNEILKINVIVNPILIADYCYLNFDKSLIKFDGKYTNYQIIENKIMNFDEFNFISFDFNDIFQPMDFNPNFGSYFSAPKADNDIKMKYYLSRERKKLLKTIESFGDESNETKIYYLFGSYGNGKTTSLIISSRMYHNICYLNLKALQLNEKDKTIWIPKLFLFEIYPIFKNTENSSLFEKLKGMIFSAYDFWIAIMTTITFFIENEIKVTIILDQYKHKIDSNGTKLAKLEKVINDENNNYVKLVVSSSINNKEVRDFIINKYVEKVIFNDCYKYYPNVFSVPDSGQLIDALPSEKKNMFNEYFNNIPSYYYKILETPDKELNITFNKIKEKIIYKIEEFYKENNLSIEDLCFIVKNFRKIEVYDKKKETQSNFTDDEIEHLIKILPIKYFIFDIQNDKIKGIYFYFKLAKICFLDVLFKKSFPFLKQKQKIFPDRLFGDLLEILIIEHFKNKYPDFFQQICYTNEIWSIDYVNGLNGLDSESTKDKNILILQESDMAKYIDFGMLLRGGNLVLIQCKKALQKMPNDYITLNKIKTEKEKLKYKFKKYFNVELNKIKLVYITGMYYDKESKKYHSWSKNDACFDVLEKITNADNIPLLFYDVYNENINIKKEDKFDICDIFTENSIILDESIYNFVEIKEQNEDIELLSNSIKKEFESFENDFLDISEFETKSINQTEKEIIEKHLDRKFLNKKRINFKEPKLRYLYQNNEDIVYTFKNNNKNYISYFNKEAKKIEIKKIGHGKISDSNHFEIKDLHAYFLKKE